MPQFPQLTQDSALAYAQLTDLIAQPDRPEVDLVIPDWTHDGQPLKLRVQGLSLVDQDMVYRAERLVIHKRGTSLPDDTDYPTFAAETLQRMILVPRLDALAARALVATRNPWLIRQLVDLGWGLADKTLSEIEAILATLTQPPPPDAPPTEPPAG